jgi:hypothetical protein
MHACSLLVLSELHAYEGELMPSIAAGFEAREVSA